MVRGVGLAQLGNLLRKLRRLRDVVGGGAPAGRRRPESNSQHDSRMVHGASKVCDKVNHIGLEMWIDQIRQGCNDVPAVKLCQRDDTATLNRSSCRHRQRDLDRFHRHRGPILGQRVAVLCDCNIADVDALAALGSKVEIAK